jgi:hypothetical protein
MPTSYRIIFEATNVCVYTVITRLHNSSKGNRWCTVIENLAGTCHAEITISYCPSSHLTGHLLPVWKILPVETVLIMMLYSSPRGKATSTPTWPGTTSSATCSRGYSTEYPPKMCSQQFHLNWTETIFPYVIVITCLDYLLRGKYTSLMSNSLEAIKSFQLTKFRQVLLGWMSLLSTETCKIRSLPGVLCDMSDEESDDEASVFHHLILSVSQHP